MSEKFEFCEEFEEEFWKVEKLLDLESENKEVFDEIEVNTGKLGD